MSVKNFYERILELEERFSLDDEGLPYPSRVLVILDIYEAMFGEAKEAASDFADGSGPSLIVQKLYQRIVELEGRLGLDANGLSYSQRVLAIIDIYEKRFLGNASSRTEEVAKAVAAVTGDSIEAKLAFLKAAIGGAKIAPPEQGPQSMEDALSGVRKILFGGAPDKTGEKNDFASLQKKARGSNVNEQTLLATDYLNHFNEIVMTIEMIPDMPELLEEAKAWRPKSYQEHFQDSSIAGKDLAIEAYDHVPRKYREPFEKTIKQIDHLIATTIEKLENDLKRDNKNLLRENATSLSRTIQKLMDTAGAIIHGSEKTMDQHEIDSLMV